MTIVRLALTPLWRLGTYRRWVHLVLGGVLFLPIALAVLVATSLVVPAATAPTAIGMVDVVALLLATVVGGLLAFVPALAAQQVSLARTLLRGPLATQPALVPTTWPGRARCAVWTAVHLLAGLGVSLATMIGLTEAALMAMTPITADPTSLLGPRLVDALATAPPWAGPGLGFVVVVALVYLVALVGLIASRLASWLLGPSAADRLAAAEARADDLRHRTRLATELHDAIGHALSVVSLQAAAAARVLEDDPDFARSALGAIADQARTATAELDHVLGLVREDVPPPVPRRTLADLPELVDAVRATGTDVQLQQRGCLDDLPPVLSSELYRLCQEALTNALRHGDASAPVSLAVARAPDRLELEVTNTLAGRRRPRRGGRGLGGMRDRVQLLGGELEAGAAGPDWCLRAHIPLHTAPDAASA